MKPPRSKGLFADVLILAGLSLVGAGLYLWRLDVALVVVGGILLVFGVVMVRNNATGDDDSAV